MFNSFFNESYVLNGLVIIPAAVLFGFVLGRVYQWAFDTPGQTPEQADERERKAKEAIDG